MSDSAEAILDFEQKRVAALARVVEQWPKAERRVYLATGLAAGGDRMPLEVWHVDMDASECDAVLLVHREDRSLSPSTIPHLLAFKNMDGVLVSPERGALGVAFMAFLLTERRKELLGEVLALIGAEGHM